MSLRRLALAGAVATAAAVAVALVGGAGQQAAPVAAVCLAGVMALGLAGAGWWPAGSGWGPALLVAAYAVEVVGSGGGVDTRAPAVAGGALLAGELTAFADGAGVAGAAWAGRRLAAIGVCALGAVFAGWLLLLVTALPAPQGTLLTVAGALAAVLAALVVAGAVRRFAGAAPPG